MENVESCENQGKIKKSFQDKSRFCGTVNLIKDEDVVVKHDWLISCEVTFEISKTVNVRGYKKSKIFHLSEYELEETHNVGSAPFGNW